VILVVGEAESGRSRSFVEFLHKRGLLIPLLNTGRYYLTPNRGFEMTVPNRRASQD
jgi:hypothetical protein